MIYKRSKIIVSVNYDQHFLHHLLSHFLSQLLHSLVKIIISISALTTWQSKRRRVTNHYAAFTDNSSTNINKANTILFFRYLISNSPLSNHLWCMNKKCLLAVQGCSREKLKENNATHHFHIDHIINAVFSLSSYLRLQHWKIIAVWFENQRFYFAYKSQIHPATGGHFSTTAIHNLWRLEWLDFRWFHLCENVYICHRSKLNSG